MKLFNLMLAASFTFTAFGADYTGPYLSRAIGTSGHTGISTTCQIFGNYKKLNLKEVKAQIEQAVEDAKNKNNYEIRQYIKFNEPSKSYVAKVVTENDGKFTTTDLVLLSDGGSFKGLKTASSKKLIKLLDALCGEAQPDPMKDAGVDKDEKDKE